MRLTVMGTGYVGLVTGTCLAEMGNDVTCVDVDPQKIAMLQGGEIPIYEPGLGELIESNVLEGRLTFSSDADEAIRQSQMIMVAVGTPPQADGSADLSAVFAVAEQVARVAPGERILVTKSTVPVGTGKRLSQRMREMGREDVIVVSNPEFLKQGDAVNDFLKPDRVVVGSDHPQATLLMQELYAPFLRTGNRLIFMDVASAEMTKYVANSFLATKISFMNEMSRLCEKVGADIEWVRAGVASDLRIGERFMFPGLGFGGSCFPKDLKALIQIGKENQCDLQILKAVAQVNEDQRMIFLQRVLDYFGAELREKTLAIWGLAFKPRTDDTREAPALTLIENLHGAGAHLRVFDPKAMSKVRQQWGAQLHYCENAYDALQGADALIIATEWNEFRRPDFERVRRLMTAPVIFDGRNLYDPSRMRERGFEYFCIGRA